MVRDGPVCAVRATRVEARQTEAKRGRRAVILTLAQSPISLATLTFSHKLDFDSWVNRPEPAAQSVQEAPDHVEN